MADPQVPPPQVVPLPPQPQVGLSVNVNAVYMNTQQRVIVITEDRAEICLRNHYDILRKGREWQTPAAILLTLILTFITTEFNDFIFSKDTWAAVFIIATILTFFWLAVTLSNLRQKTSVQDILATMKEGAIIDSNAPRI